MANPPEPLGHKFIRLDPILQKPPPKTRLSKHHPLLQNHLQFKIPNPHPKFPAPPSTFLQTEQNYIDS